MKHEELLKELEKFDYQSKHLVKVKVGDKEDTITDPNDAFSYDIYRVLILHKHIQSVKWGDLGELWKIKEVIRSQMIVMTMTSIEIFLEDFLINKLIENEKLEERLIKFKEEEKKDLIKGVREAVELTDKKRAIKENIKNDRRCSFQERDFIKKAYKILLGQELKIKEDSLWQRIFSKGPTGKGKISYMRARHSIIHIAGRGEDNIQEYTGNDEFTEDCIIDSFSFVSSIINQYGEPKKRLVQEEDEEKIVLKFQGGLKIEPSKKEGD